MQVAETVNRSTVRNIEGKSLTELTREAVALTAAPLRNSLLFINRTAAAKEFGNKFPLLALCGCN
jgi:hypothetical protein